jgi:transposase
MKVKPVLALPEGLEVTAIEMIDEVLTITAVSRHVSPCCPLCGTPALRVHSRYTRQITDLPCSGQQVRLLVQVRKCFCQVPGCARKIFLERLTPFVEPWARVTRRLYQIVQILGLATGGRLGIRVTDRLGIETSRHTILRRIMALPTELVREVSQIGIDDFSFRRGRKFGTIIVDLQTHKVLDVLADRTADTSAAWIAAHPEIELVSRDRGGDYAAAARKAAPQATQTADRFHLLKNLGEALEGVLARHFAAHRKRQTETAKASPILALQTPQSSNMLPKNVVLSQAKREERLAQYQQVVALRQLGFSQTAIAEQTGIGHATVSRWLRNGTFPEQKPRPRKASVDPHLPQLIERWEAGCHTIAELHRELSITLCIGGLPVPFQKSQKSGLHVPFQKDRRSKRLLISFHILQCWHDKQCSFFFVDLKNSRLKNKKRSSSFDLSTPKSIGRMSWSSNLLRCFARARVSGSMIGSAT